MKACRTSYDYLDIYMVVKPDIRFYQLLKLIKSFAVLAIHVLTQCIKGIYISVLYEFSAPNYM